MDVCKNRHRGNAQSEAANDVVQPYKLNMRERIFFYVFKSRQYGVTCEDIVRDLGMKLQSVSARVSELKATNRVVEDGTRNGYSILRPMATQKSLFP